ncbi:MAG: hypothetical protein ACRDGA_13055, partial [Bacteroidota bacterium]
MKNLFKGMAVVLLFYPMGISLHAQTVEVTEEFRKVLKELAKEEFRRFVYTRLKEKEPLIAASSYNLIERVVAGDSFEELKRQTVLSLLDYALFVQIESMLKSAYPQARIVDSLGKRVDAKAYKRLTQIGALLVYEYLARDSLYVIWGGMRKMLAEETRFVTSHKVDDDKFGLVVSNFIDSARQAITEMLELDRFLRMVAVGQSPLDSVQIESYKQEFSRIVKKEFGTEREFVEGVLLRFRTKMVFIIKAYES